MSCCTAFIFAQQFFNTAQQILHCANFAHILRSQLIEFTRHIIGIDVFEAGNERLFLS